MQCGRQPKGDTAFDLGPDSVRIDHPAAIHGTRHSRHPRCRASIALDLGNGCDGTVAHLMYRESGPDTGVTSRPVAGLFQRHEDAVLERPGSEESQSEVEWISARLCRELVDHGLDHECVREMVYTAPDSRCYAGVRGLPNDGQVRYVVRRSCSVDTPADDAMIPGGNAAISSQHRSDTVSTAGVILVMLEVILASPL